MLQTLPQIIDQSATRYPDHPAFRFRDRTVRYAELARSRNRLANVLAAAGVAPGDRVGIYMPKELECATALYGIMQAGAVYVPLDPTAPPARIATIMADCGIRCLVSHNSHRRRLGQLAGALIQAGMEPPTLVGPDWTRELPWPTIPWSAVAHANERAPGIERNADDPAYIIYTSGSTGEPKGIVHTHGSGLRYAHMAAALYGLSHQDRLSNFPPLHFDQSTFDFFSGPLAGATTVIIPDAVKLLPASLSQLIQDEKLTVWYSVPFALIQLLLRGAPEQRDLRSLRWVIYGGEPFPRKHLEALAALLPQAQLSNNYGPAEVNQVTFCNMPPLPPAGADVPIGKPCPGVSALVVDEHDQPAPSGAEGELLVATPTMMAGYWNRPERNAAAFCHRVDHDGVTRRYYRTGDLVRLDPAGDYHFLGRMDRQIKSRGYRVELDEVETALLTHPQVEEGAAFPVRDDEGNTLIRAAVIARAGTAPSAGELLRHLAGALPAYALPVAVEVMTAFPRTTSGKIDRRALAQNAPVV